MSALSSFHLHHTPRPRTPSTHNSPHVRHTVCSHQRHVKTTTSTSLSAPFLSLSSVCSLSLAHSAFHTYLGTMVYANSCRRAHADARMQIHTCERGGICANPVRSVGSWRFVVFVGYTSSFFTFTLERALNVQGRGERFIQINYNSSHCRCPLWKITWLLS